MRVVVDTNVWISGLISPAGSPARVVQAVLDGQIIPVFSRQREILFAASGGFANVPEAAGFAEIEAAVELERAQARSSAKER